MQLTEYSSAQMAAGCFYLVTPTGEHGPFDTYVDAVNAAEHPHAVYHGVDPRRGYCIVDRGDPIGS